MALQVRKLDQSILMDDIKVTILKTKRGYLQIGIEVTDAIKLHREMIYKRVVIESKIHENKRRESNLSDFTH